MATSSLSLSAGTVPDCPIRDLADLAAAAGYDAFGVRLADDTTTDHLSVLRRRADDLGVAVFDLEVVRIRADGYSTDVDRLVDAGAILGASWVLATCEDPDRARARARLAALADKVGSAGQRVGLEPMVFTALHTVGEAIEFSSGIAGVAVIVDVLHHHRAGQHASDLAGLDRDRLAYVQLCDAPLAAPDGGVEALATEARTRRLTPGEGELPLVDYLRALGPGTLPITIEVQQVDGAQRAGPSVRAAHHLAAARALLKDVGIGP
jgi:sugar phosphate isomerase/epimerase